MAAAFATLTSIECIEWRSCRIHEKGPLDHREAIRSPNLRRVSLMLPSQQLESLPSKRHLDDVGVRWELKTSISSERRT